MKLILYFQRNKRNENETNNTFKERLEILSTFCEELVTYQTEQKFCSYLSAGSSSLRPDRPEETI